MRKEDVVYRFIIAPMTGIVGMYLGSLFGDVGFVVGGLLGFLIPFLVAIVKIEKDLDEIKKQNEAIRAVLSHHVNSIDKKENIHIAK